MRTARHQIFHMSQYSPTSCSENPTISIHDPQLLRAQTRSQSSGAATAFALAILPHNRKGACLRKIDVVKP